jgi:hypothetical protein
MNSVLDADSGAADDDFFHHLKGNERSAPVIHGRFPCLFVVGAK